MPLPRSSRRGRRLPACYAGNLLIEACAVADSRTFVVCQERTGLHMADAYSRVNSGDRIGVFPSSTVRVPGTRSAVWPKPMASPSPSWCFQPVTHAGKPGWRPTSTSPFNYRYVTKQTERVPVPEVMRRAAPSGPGRSPHRPALGEEVAEPLGYAPSFATRSGPDPADVPEGWKSSRSSMSGEVRRAPSQPRLSVVGR